MFVPLFAYYCIYRGLLYWDMAHAETPPKSLVWQKLRWAGLVLTSTDDVHFCAFFSLIAVGTFGAARRLGWPRWTGKAAVLLGALLVGVITAAHYRLLFSLGNGLDADSLVELRVNRSPADIAAYSEPIDWAFVFGLPLMVGLVPLLPGLLHRALSWALGSYIAFLYVLAVFSWHPNHYGRAVWRSPTVHLAFEVFESLFGLPTVHLALEHPLSATQQGQLHLVDPSFQGDEVPGLPMPEVHAKNVLLVILESTGAEYVQDLPPGTPDPMNYLHRLASQGLMLAQHHSTANTSPRSIWSILSGLYPSTQRSFFCIRSDVSIPDLSTRMGPHTESFLYTPGRLQSFFPRGFLTNNGFDLVGFDELGDMGVPRWAANGRDERLTVQAFIDRMARAEEPFVGVYYSYVPHFWYQDQGPEWRLLPDVTLKQNRYVNGLFMMDHLLARLVWALHEQGRDDDTLVVVTGDHGEAFAQHPGDITHSQHMWEVDIRVPAVIVGPGIPVARIDANTSHVDLLPTLLDAMGKPYDPATLQGESLFRPDDRKQIFSVGTEQELIAIDRAGRKALVSYRSDRCSAWDLAQDPDEQHKLDCSGVGDLRQSIADFHGFQPGALVQANAAAP